jgi:hypothetical protein
MEPLREEVNHRERAVLEYPSAERVTSSPQPAQRVFKILVHLIGTARNRCPRRSIKVMRETVDWVDHDVTVRWANINGFALGRTGKWPRTAQAVVQVRDKVRPACAVELDHAADIRRGVCAGVDISRLVIDRQVVVEKVKLTCVGDAVTLPLASDRIATYCAAVSSAADPDCAVGSEFKVVNKAAVGHRAKIGP